MSINATGSNYMSNTDILEWMETKTDGLYGQMRGAMDVADTRANAEAALDKVKADLGNLKGGDAQAVYDEVNATLAQYKDVPEVAQALQPIADELGKRYDQRAHDASTPVLTVTGPHDAKTMELPPPPPPVTITSDDATQWSKDIGDQVDVLGKQDQLGLINIQEFNSQVNQAKQTASALMDASDKSAADIINHIA